MPAGTAEPVAPTAPPGSSDVRPPSAVDMPLAPTNAAVPFHLVVSNQSFTLPLVDINVFVDGTHVVMGDFPVGSQHSFYTFDFPVYVGSHEIKAVTKKGSVTFSTTFPVPAERWGVLTFSSDTGETSRFDYNVMDEEPMFQ